MSKYEQLILYRDPKILLIDIVMNSNSQSFNLLPLMNSHQYLEKYRINPILSTFANSIRYPFSYNMYLKSEIANTTINSDSFAVKSKITLMIFIGSLLYRER